MSKLKKLVIAMVATLGWLGLFACFESKAPNLDDVFWTDDNIIKVGIRDEYVDSVYKNPDAAFEYLDLSAVMISEKYFANEYNSLSLRLILKNDAKHTRDEALALLRADEKVESASLSKEVPFETVNTLRIVPSSTTVAVGDKITLALEGEYKKYLPSFAFDQVIVSLFNHNPNKEYKSEDFPNAGIKSVKKWELSYITYFTLTLETPGYFEVVKAIDTLARDSKIETAWLNGLGYPDLPVPPLWESSDIRTADFQYAPKIYGNYDLVRTKNGGVFLEGLKQGKVTVTYSAGYSVLVELDNNTTSIEITVLPTVFEGIEIKTELTAYPVGVQQILVTWKNNTERMIDFGAGFSIEQKIDGEWVDAFPDANPTFNSVAYMLEPDKTVSFSYYIPAYTDNIQAGEYRIVCTYLRPHTTGNPNQQNGNSFYIFSLYAEFDVQ